MSASMIESIIDDFEGYGYGIKVDEFSIRSHTEDTVVAIEGIYDGDNIVGLTLFSNDTEVDSIYYDDEHFAAKLANTLSNELNV